MSFNEALFYWINQDGGHHYAWLDSFMVFMSNPKASFIPLTMVAAYVLLRDRPRWRILVGLVLVIGIDDWLGGQLKHYLQAERPCAVLDAVRLLKGCSINSFPSNHAANTAAFAVYIAMFYRKSATYIWLLPFLVGVSRIYVGVHYPFDVVGGWVLGSIVAIAAYYFHGRVIHPSDAVRPETERSH